MTNPFANRAQTLNGPAMDIQPITPHDTNMLPVVGLAIYAQTGGAVKFLTASGDERTVTVGNFSMLPVGVKAVRATGTTATGLHALVLA